MTTIAPDWLAAPATRSVLAALAPASPHFVGGCVRDALMGRATHDIDIAVVTPPEETMRLAVAGGLTAHPTGIGHGVVTVVADGMPFEVATLRRDVATDGRRAVVAFTDDRAEDAARRDFTINALYADASGRVADPLGEGLADLAARRIRFIGAAQARIREDYLRILRFFRFHAQFGIETFDPAGLAACHALADGLAKISRERIGAELLKLLSAPDPEPALAAMGPVLALAAPGATAFSGLVARETAMGLAPDPLRRLAALGATGPRGALRLSNADAAHLRDIGAARGLSPEEAAWRHGRRAAEASIALAAAPPPADWRARLDAAARAALPIGAADLLAAGAAPGPAVGAALRRAETRWIADRFTTSRDDLLRLALAETGASGGA